MSRTRAGTDGVIRMGNVTWRSGVAVGVAAVMVASAASALVVMLGGTASASADEARTRCVRALRAKRAWRATYVETDNGSDGKKTVVRTEVTVRRPGDYRVVVREQDERGREIVATSIRLGGTLYTRRVEEDGKAVMHVMKGVRPSLGVEMDNALGETIQSIADATTLRLVGFERVQGRTAQKLELAPNRFVWVDAASGLPVREQEMSGEAVLREVRFDSFEADPVVMDTDFEVVSLGSVESTIVEDLGFRPVESPSRASDVLGFDPIPVTAPTGYRIAEQGYCDPRVSPGDREPEATYVTLLVNGANSMLITQSERPGLGDDMYPVTADEPDAPRVIDLGGRRALLHSDPVGAQLMLVRRDILISVEANISDEALVAFGNTIQ